MGCCCKSSSNIQPRRIYLESQNPAGSSFPHNSIHTTKYNFITFLPKSILLQFSRVPNYVYLVSAILQFLPIISTLSPVVSLAPLLVVTLISIVRQGYEDYKRYVNDKSLNKTTTTILMSEGFQQKTWADVRVGQYIKVLNKQTIPADLILLSSTQGSGVAFVQTASLDGEKNLKSKYTVSSVPKIYPEDYNSLKGRIQVQSPNKNIHELNGTIEFEGLALQKFGNYNVLLRGTVLKNTHYVIGIVIYTGHDTKIMMNLGEFKHKTSFVERRLNWIQLYLSIILVLICSLCGILYYYNTPDTRPFYMIGASNLTQIQEAAVSAMANFLLLNFIIPISMNISLEALKTFQAVFLGLDHKMMVKIGQQDQACKVLNPLIIQQLGNISYILTDKTGTLTSNTMEFREIWINGSTMDDKEIRNLHPTKLASFWTFVILCHDAVKDTEKDQYQGSSADEVCFLKYASTIGFNFLKRTKTHIQLEILGAKRVLELIIILPFTQRKMMSVVYKDLETGVINIISKGADSSIFARRDPSYSFAKFDSINSFLTTVSKRGLRTLVFGHKTLSVSDTQRLMSEHQTFQQNRRRKVFSRESECQAEDELYRNFQNQLNIVGATAIEDKLQDGVPEAISTFRQAGIKVVMITGDKLQTAQNIGYLSNFIDNSATVFRTKSEDDVVSSMIELIDSLQDTNNNFSFVVQGQAISRLINSTDNFVIQAAQRIIRRCNSMIFCRSTPSQKAEIVKYFKNMLDGAVLAIGDGGNDANMIKEADIGVGLIGNEGNQAAFASDVYFGQFRFLQRLLMHHGRWSYFRTSYFFMYYGFKNNAITIILFLYQIYCGFSGTYNLSQIYQASYNSFLGLALTFYMGIFQQDINSDQSSLTIKQLPAIYKSCRKQDLFSYKRYTTWALFSIACSCWLFFPTLYCLDSQISIDEAGRISDWNSIMASLQVSSFVLVTGVLILDIQVHNWLTLLCILGGTLTIVIAVFLVQNFLLIDGFEQCFLALSNNFNLRFWLLTFLLPSVVMVLKISYMSLELELFPSLIQSTIKSSMCLQEEGAWGITSVELKNLTQQAR